MVSRYSPAIVCSPGPVYGELYDSAKISSLKGIRENQKYNNCVAVHRAFGDIFMAYERKRSKLSRQLVNHLVWQKVIGSSRVDKILVGTVFNVYMQEM